MWEKIKQWFEDTFGNSNPNVPNVPSTPQTPTNSDESNNSNNTDSGGAVHGK